jgi:stage III sporulation protein AG
MNDFFKAKIRKITDSKNRVKLIMVVGIIGMVLIMLSDILPQKEESEEKEVLQTELSENDETDLYKKSIEEQLKTLLEEIEGVGECDIMVTVEGTTEYVYAENISEYTDSETDRQSDKYESSIVFTEKDGEKSALVKKIIKPQINGVAVVCEGGGNVAVNERVLKAVSTALNISTGKICVEAKKQ